MKVYADTFEKRDHERTWDHHLRTWRTTYHDGDMGCRHYVMCPHDASALVVVKWPRYFPGIIEAEWLGPMPTATPRPSPLSLWGRRSPAGWWIGSQAS